MNFRNKDNALVPMGNALKRVKVANSIYNDEAVSRLQLTTNDIDKTDSGDNTFSGANAFSGVNTFSGNNTHSGTETFSNTAGVTTDTITPRTSGAGTIVKRPAGIFTTTPIAAASLLSNGVYGVSKADGIALTLPTLSTANIGYTIRFHIITTSTAGGYIWTSAATNVMIGGLWSTIANPDAANDMEFNIATGTNNTLTLGATTACGLAGGYVDFTAISATQWAVSGVVLGSGALASNLFTTV